MYDEEIHGKIRKHERTLFRKYYPNLLGKALEKVTFRYITIIQQF